MKKVALFVVMAFSCFSTVFAIPKFKALHNFKKKTIVVVEVAPIDDSYRVKDMVFHNNGKAYECKGFKIDSTKEALTISARFKKMKRFKNCYLTFMLNGRLQHVNVILIE